MRLPGFITALSALMAFTVSVEAGEPDWSVYEQLLERHVSPGEEAGIQHTRVDYSALADDPLFHESISLIENHPTSQLETREQRLAFHINAYNLFAIRMVVENRPLDSIRDAGSLFSPVWGKEIGEIDSEPVTLDMIEHDIIRGMDEARIHFAVNCASLSCPDLRREPYTAARLDEQLDDQTRSFLDSPDKGLREEADRIRVSQIFDWYAEDFEEEAGSVRAWISRYRDLPENKRLRANLPYNWELNGE